MSRDPRKHHELRTHVGDALYQRMLREAAASGERLSEIARAGLSEAFAARDVLANSLRAPRSIGGAMEVVPLPLLELEQRLADQLTVVDARLVRVEAMIDRLYYGLMLHMAEVPIDARGARSASAGARHRAWVEAVDHQVGDATSAAGPTAAERKASSA